MSEKIKVGVVGCGVVAAAYYLPYLMRYTNLVAVCDAVEERARECQRIFNAKEVYSDYDTMLAKADIDAVFILTGPGTHKRFAVAAAEAGKHFLLQKPMATTFDDLESIVKAVRQNKVKAVIEPSSPSPMEPRYPEIRDLVKKGVLGAPYWFSYIYTAPTHYHPSLGGNPYGVGAFYSKDSGGVLFDYSYWPSDIVTVLGPCKSVMAMSKLSIPERQVVPESEYTQYLKTVTDPDDANYWDVVLDKPKTETITMGADDNVFVLYELQSGFTGVLHVGRAFHPVPKGVDGGGFRIFGHQGNIILGANGNQASIISTRRDLLPQTDAEGWYHIPAVKQDKPYVWPKPGAFNYYHESSKHLIDCIQQDRDPIINVEWGRHITEMLTGAVESAQSGRRYEMKSTLEY
jgi:predicted dehydrogenase